MNTEILIILGGFLSLLLGICGYLLKDILKQLNEVRIELAKLLTEHTIYKDMVLKHEEELVRTRDRIHSLEGAQNQLLHLADKLASMS